MDDSGLGETGAVKLWDVASGKERATLKGHSLAVGAVAFSADGKTLASATHDNRGRPAEMKLWDAASGQERASLGVAGGGALLLVFTADGKRLTAGCLDGTIRVWQAARP